MGDEDEGEEQGGEEGADVVEGEDAGDEILELEAVLEEAEQEGDFESDECAGTRQATITARRVEMWDALLRCR